MNKFVISPLAKCSRNYTDFLKPRCCKVPSLMGATKGFAKASCECTVFALFPGGFCERKAMNHRFYKQNQHGVTSSLAVGHLVRDGLSSKPVFDDIL
jgi:hypothetical protein